MAESKNAEARVDVRDRTRQRIVAVARELYEEKGVQGLSMRLIAKRVGLPTMTLYGYFPNKIAIVRALWSMAFDPLFAAMRKAERAPAEPVQRLSLVANSIVDYWLEHPDLYRLVFLVEDRRERGDPNWFISETDVVASYMRLAPLIAAARGTPDIDCTAAAEALNCALTGIAHMRITVSEYPWAPSASYVDLILAGVIHGPLPARDLASPGQRSAAR
ncbi:TetR/AcrR family transcriptional regulator [Sphingopyxis sp. LARHCG72]